MNVTNSQFDLLTRLLDLTSLRHRTIAQNVANVNTPGYHRLDVSFDDNLAKILSGQKENAALPGKAKVVEAPGGAAREDGNNVDIDAEMGRLNKNALLYNAYTQILASKIGAMRSAITGR
jgi:flagellar basal-body rod protein FlgB